MTLHCKRITLWITIHCKRIKLWITIVQSIQGTFKVISQKWVITAEEAEFLYQIPYRAQVLYALYLRRHMDFETGLVGVKRKISFKAMQEAMEVKPLRGSKEPHLKPTISFIRAILNVLIKVGLIIKQENKNNSDCIIFKLPMAYTGSVRLNEERQRNDKGRTTRSTTRVSPYDTGAVAKSTTIGTNKDFDPKLTRNDTHQEQDIKLTFNNKYKSTDHKKYSNDFNKFWLAYPLKKSKAKAYQIWLKLKPSQELLGIMLQAIVAQADEKQKLHAAGNFVASWKHPTTWLNQECWNDEPYPELKNLENHPNGQNHRPKKLSTVDKANQAADEWLKQQGIPNVAREQTIIDNTSGGQIIDVDLLEENERGNGSNLDKPVW